MSSHSPGDPQSLNCPLPNIPINPNQQNPPMASNSFLPPPSHLMGASLPMPPHLAHQPQALYQVPIQLYSETNNQTSADGTGVAAPEGKKMGPIQQQKFGDKEAKTRFVDTGKQEMPTEPVGKHANALGAGLQSSRIGSY
ncbi:hypothetical protein BY996DRAFT_6421793 [Phakopsora pachyrhizi]|nr:hypothetical protein BY996DRAFT_6421793 [Phakopsora pachyrhizi]